MKIPKFKKTCFCIDLAIGAAVIGWLGSIFALIYIAATIYHLTGVNASLDVEIVFGVVLSLLLFAVSVCLMLATQRENRRLVIPWLVINILNVIAANTLFVHFAVETGAIATLLILGVCDFLFIYVWLCIYSYYYDLKMGY